jgi:hypothetical protein
LKLQATRVAVGKDTSSEFQFAFPIDGTDLNHTSFGVVHGICDRKITSPAMPDDLTFVHRSSPIDVGRIARTCAYALVENRYLYRVNIGMSEMMGNEVMLGMLME